jgi:naphtho-gamma-pyrone polyketide synthase
MSVADYMLKANNMRSGASSLDVGEMKVLRPLISDPNSSTQLFRVSAVANWSTKVISITFYSVNPQGKKLGDHATCKVGIVADQTWLQDWRKISYLIKSRITALQKGVDGGDSHKLKRGMVYKLFSTLVDYDSKYQGMQEVVLDSNELEATAKVSFQVDEEDYFLNPRWIDSLGHIAGFIMNGNDNVQSKSQVFVNHGWDTMRCATKFARGKTYQSYNKMQPVDGNLYSGDTYIFEEDNIVAVFEGVKVNLQLARSE